MCSGCWGKGYCFWSNFGRIYLWSCSGSGTCIYWRHLRRITLDCKWYHCYGDYYFFAERDAAWIWYVSRIFLKKTMEKKGVGKNMPLLEVRKFQKNSRAYQLYQM